MESGISVRKAKARDGKLECEYENIVRLNDTVNTDEVIMKGGANYHPDLRGYHPFGCVV